MPSIHDREKILSRIFLAGAHDFEVARRIGFEPFKTIEDAIAEAEATLGSDCSIVYPYMPPMYIPSIGTD